MTNGAGSTAPDPDLNVRLRSLPQVELLAARLADLPSRPGAVAAARTAIGEARAALRAGASNGTGNLEGRARELYAEAEKPRLRPVLNATGVIVHTNLGRAPLPQAALDAVAATAGGYSNLEYDLASGDRGSRHAHVEELICALTGAQAAMAVNNGAAAVLLAAAALAGDGRELVVSRGQLIEIGGSFRIPDVVAQSGAALVEVGTTNRTRAADYERAFGDRTGAALRVHASNFRTVGFVEEVSIEELCQVARRAHVPVIDDVGSGAVVDDLDITGDEPPVKRSVAAGCAVVCFSGDKLLGGPQAGLMVGRADAIDACRGHPLARALRIDKLSLAALEATLRIYRDPARALREVPVLRMLVATDDELAARAELMRSRLDAGGITAAVIRAPAKVGGGALPLLELDGPVCAVDPGTVPLGDLVARLRAVTPPVVGRARGGCLLMDPRTLDDTGAEAATDAVIAVVGQEPPLQSDT